ncbi:glutathione peroxidase [soil metagenome]
MDNISVFEIPVKKIDGTDSFLKPHQGKVLLVVNTASKCGLTPQYEGLESLAKNYREQGLEVLGFPSNEFMGQEPGSNADIQEFCSTKFNITFPLFEKINVKGGPAQHPLYKLMTTKQPTALMKTGSDFKEKLVGYGQSPKQADDVLWNFEKFLIGRNGEILGRFAPDIEPNDPVLVTAIEKALKTPIL